MNRRDLLRLGLLGGSAALVQGCKGLKPTFLTGLLGRAGTGDRPTGPVSWVASTCLQCEAGCGIRVKTIAGDAKKIEGNPLHPINRGGLCPKGQAGLQVLYDPDRLRGPLRRVGVRGAGRWERLSWDEAIDEVGGRLAAIRRDGDPASVVVMSGRCRGHMQALLDRFATCYGTPNRVDTHSIGTGNAHLAHLFTQGVHDFLAYDWEGAKTVFAFGANLLETFRPTVLVQRCIADGRAQPERGMRLVTIDPRFSVTASKSDEWIPIKPGTDGALALAMAHVIVAEGLYDREFVQNHTSGFEEWRAAVLDAYPVEAAAGETGLEADVIVRLARDFALRRPSIAVAGSGAGMHPNGLYNLLAVHSLNALVGNLGARGGVLVQQPPSLGEWPALELDEVARNGLAQPRLDGAGTARFPLARSASAALPDALLSRQPYRAKALLFYYTNPLFSAPDPERFRAALDEIPLLVSFSPFRDESTAMADFVLPDHTFLERWQLDVPPASVGYPVVGLRQPVVEPLYETKATDDVLMRLARVIGGTVAASFPWEDGLELLRAEVAGTAAAAGVDAETFWEALVADGVWAGGPYEFGDTAATLRTPSGRFEFVSSLMEQELGEVARRESTSTDALAARLGLAARGRAVYMPHYEQPRPAADPERYPLRLNAYKPMMHAEGRGGNQPWLHESFGVQLGESWDSWVEINPETARRLGIRDGDRVWVESPLGRVATKARLFAGVRPEVVNIPFEYGHTEGGRWARHRGVNPNALTACVHDALCGTVSRSDAWVAVYLAASAG